MWTFASENSITMPLTAFPIIGNYFCTSIILLMNESQRFYVGIYIYTWVASYNIHNIYDYSIMRVALANIQWVYEVQVENRFHANFCNAKSVITCLLYRSCIIGWTFLKCLSFFIKKNFTFFPSQCTRKKGENKYVEIMVCFIIYTYTLYILINIYNLFI